MPGEEPMPELMADFAAMDVQRALQVVPRQYSRVLAAVYIPGRERAIRAASHGHQAQAVA